MNPFTQRNQHSLSLAVGVLSVFAFAGMAAHAGTKPSAPAPHASAPASHAAPASHPAGGAAGGASHSAGASTAGHTGPTTSGHTGPTTSGHTGPTASGGHTGPTTSNPHGTGASTGGTHSPTAAGGGHTGGTGAAGGGHAGGAGGNTVHSTNPHATTSATGHLAPASSHTVKTANGSVTKRSNGKVSDVHDEKHGMDVHHGLNGSKQVSVKRADGSRVVAERGRPGYVERGFHQQFHGHDFARRSYYYHGRYYDRYYRGYYYGGVYINVYAPAYYYGPGFYGWAYNPWYSPVGWAWGWGGNPWYGYYGFYFNPYPVYAGPAFWLTDYLVASELQAAYAAQVEAHTEAVAAAAAGQPLLSEAIKAQIADEVKAQIALENQEATVAAAGNDPEPNDSSVARMVQMADGKPHVFVAASALDVVDANGNECAISDGDALEITTPAQPGATDANLIVLSSKGGQECQRSATVTVAVTDLQEMQNHMRETIDDGLKELQAKQGTGGLPAAPASAKAPPTQAAFTAIAPPPEPPVDKDVNQQLAVADQVDSSAASATPIGGVDSSASAAAPAATVNISLGQSIDDVKAALGNPLTVIDLGTKKIYKYKDMKITFKAGKVSDVE